jgi:hypothetical protein
MGCCTGTLTSTFGGGGGTKLFCSQPVSAANADSTKTIRPPARALCPRLPFSPAQPDEREGFISLPYSSWLRKGFAREGFSRSKPSKHPLAVELETENDAGGENFQLIR